jgi:hypothetical protein
MGALHTYKGRHPKAAKELHQCLAVLRWFAQNQEQQRARMPLYSVHGEAAPQLRRFRTAEMSIKP